MSDLGTGVDNKEEISRRDLKTPASDGAPNLFFILPRELRDEIYIMLLTNYDKQLPTFGAGSRIDISILMLNKSTYTEALPVLYSTHHKMTLHYGYIKPWTRYTKDILEHPKQIRGATPTRQALGLMHELSIAVNFSTLNRGGAEVSIQHAAFWEEKLLYIATSILRSESLHTLTISLWNENQRKVGAKRIRSPEVIQQMSGLLQPFAYLPRTVNVSITGFDTIEYFELFEAMRNDLAGKEMSLDEYMSGLIPSLRLIDARETMLIARRRAVFCPEWEERHLAVTDMSRLL